MPARPRSTLASLICWLPPVLLLGVAGAMWLLVDRWWLAVPLGYGPRWPWLVLVPLPLLAAAPWRRRLTASGVSLLVVSWGILGWRAPLPWRATGNDSSAVFRVVSFNAALKRDAIAALLEDADNWGADLLVVVECPRAEPRSVGSTTWRDARAGEVCVWSRSQQSPQIELARKPTREIGWSGSIATVTIPGTLVGPVGVVHLRSVRNELTEFLDVSEVREQADELSAHHDKRIRGSVWASEWFRSLEEVPSIVLGDFNLVPESVRLREDWGHWNDAWEQAGLGTGYTWYSRWSALRIDRVIHDRGWITRSVRVGADIGSDHRPVLVELVRNTTR